MQKWGPGEEEEETLVHFLRIWALSASGLLVSVTLLNPIARLQMRFSNHLNHTSCKVSWRDLSYVTASKRGAVPKIADICALSLLYESSINPSGKRHTWVMNPNGPEDAALLITMWHSIRVWLANLISSNVLRFIALKRKKIAKCKKSHRACLSSQVGDSGVNRCCQALISWVETTVSTVTAAYAKETGWYRESQIYVLNIKLKLGDS